MNFRKNEQTGKSEAQFTGKLISVAAIPLQNVNGTEYYPCTVEFQNSSDEVKQISALIYANNFKYGMKVGESYLCTATHNPEETDPRRKVLVTVSHLQSTIGERATEDMFGFVSEVTEESVTPQPH